MSSSRLSFALAFLAAPATVTASAFSPGISKAVPPVVAAASKKLPIHGLTAMGSTVFNNVSLQLRG